MKLDRLPWIDVAPYDQILTNLISSCQQRDVSLICVQGPNGSGKSRILTELLSTLSFDATASLIALSGNENEVFYHNVELSSNLLNMKDGQFLHNFTLTLESILKDKQHFYILIDDVEFLSYDLLQGIILIISENPRFKAQVTLVVFMGVAPIHLETRRLFRGAEMITLKGMSVSEAKQFIDKVYHHTHQQKSLTMSDVNHLHGLSYGYAGRLIKLLEQYLEPNIKDRSHKKLWLAIGLSTLLVLFSVWIFFPYQESDVPVKVTTVAMVEKAPPTLVKKEVVQVKTILPVKDISIDSSEMIGPLLLDDKNPFIGPVSVVEPKVTSEIEVLKVKPENTAKVEAIDKKTVSNYVIELGRHRSKVQLENMLKGRSIPGKAQFKQIEMSGSKIWVAYIGPYGSEAQATQGKIKLPASLQSLPLKVNKEF